MNVHPKEINNAVRRIACPCCMSQNIENLGGMSYSDPICFSSVHISLTERPELWKCLDCYSGFTQNIIAEEDAFLLYAGGESNRRWKAVPFERSKTSEVLVALKRIFSNANNVVDVGSNTGELLDLAKNHGCRTTGVELSVASRHVLTAKGHNALPSLENVGDGSVDVLIAFDLIEHLHDVNSFVQLCWSKLADSGALVLLTGDITSTSARLAGPRWWYANYCEHIVFPSMQYLSALPNFELFRITRTLASRGYQSNLFMSLLSVVLRLPTKTYRGLPAIGADHFLIELRKK